MRQLPPSRASSGYTPNRLKPLALAPVSDQGQRLTDIQAIQRLFAKGENGGYWPADPAYLYEDSAGTIPASLNGVVGLWVNNVSGKPNAIQATTANKPYLRRTPVSNKYWLDSNTETGALAATFASSLGSACTIATVGAEGVTILEGQTITTTYNIAPAYGYNGDVLIINRALTAVEKALVTRVLGRNVPTLGQSLVLNGDNEGQLFSTPTGAKSVGSVMDEALESSVYGSGSYAKYTSNSATNSGHRMYLDILSAGKTYLLSGKSYVPTGGIARFVVYDVYDGSWFSPSNATKNQWISFSYVRVKASNWGVAYGNNSSESIAIGNVCFLLDDISVKEIL